MSISVTLDESEANMSHDNDVPDSTICRWLKNEDKLHDFVDTVDSTDWMKRKMARTVQKTNNLTMWFSCSL